MSHRALGDQFHSTTVNDGWGELPAHFKPETPGARKQREDSEYGLARHAEDMHEERVTSGHKTDTALYRAKVGPRLNYSQWMRERAAS